MTNANVGDVIAQLRVSIDRLDAAAVTASSAGADALEAQQILDSIAASSGGFELTQSVVDAGEAVAKIAKVARLLSDAAGHLLDYATHIAPGSLPVGSPSVEVTPSGADVVGRASGGGSLSDRMLGRLASVKNNDDGLQHIKKIGDAVQNAVRPGGVVSSAGKSETITKASQQGGGAGDAILATMTLAVVAVKGVEWVRRVRTDSAKRRREATQDQGSGDGR